MSNPITDMISETFKNIQSMVDVDTIIGDPITAPDGTIIVPISKVSFGFAGGGNEFPQKDKTDTTRFGGAMGGGASVKADAFLVIAGGNVRLIPVNGSNSSVDKLIDMIPTGIDKLNGFMDKRKEKKAAAEEK